jgi:preprotein translocase subunit SecA
VADAPGALVHAGLRLPRPEPRAERRPLRERWWDRALAAAAGAALARTTRWRGHGLARILPALAAEAGVLAGLDDAALAARALPLRAALRRAPAWPDAALLPALALAREAAHRTLGQRAHDVQMLGAYAALRGMLAEMATGEGKTLAATLAACVGGLAGTPVHVVTVNRYLAERDHAAGLPLYDFLGLTAGLVTEAVPPEARRAAYACDVTICTSKDLAFDYMRDRLAAGPGWRRGALREKARRLAGAAEAAPLLRGLHVAIVDEADSVLIDEARTPLILAGPAPAPRDPAVHDLGLTLAAALRPGIEFELHANERRVALLPAGRRALAAAAPDAPPWDEVAERERLVLLALTALHALERDEHYLVRAGKAEIIDEFSGRIMADRSWSDGLQEMVERKEGLALSERHAVEARMTYQRFFRRYRRLAGMTGTAREVAAELWRTYRLRVAAIPTNRPDAKRFAACRGHADDGAKWRAIVAEVGPLHARGVPVLIGTRTVAASHQATAALTAAGLRHRVLSAAQDAEEALTVAAAGAPGAITVATNMAGRGTDIRLAPGVGALGGLHVIVSEPHEARRIDRQLAGRCGRQGDPGEVLPHVSLDDALLQRHLPPAACALLRGAARLGSAQWGARFGAQLAQRRAESLHARMRRELLRSDEWLNDAMAFAGEPE